MTNIAKLYDSKVIACYYRFKSSDNQIYNNQILPFSVGVTALQSITAPAITRKHPHRLLSPIFINISTIPRARVLFLQWRRRRRSHLKNQMYTGGVVHGTVSHLASCAVAGSVADQWRTEHSTRQTNSKTKRRYMGGSPHM